MVQKGARSFERDALQKKIDPEAMEAISVIYLHSEREQQETIMPGGGTGYIRYAGSRSGHS